MDLEIIKQKIQAGLPGAKAQILDPRKDGVHLKAIVYWEGFKGKTLIEQHRLIYATLKAELASNELHALQIETKDDEELSI